MIFDSRQECDPQYNIVYLNRAQQPINTAQEGITLLRYGRKLDEISSSSITYGMGDVGESCCRQLKILEPWQHSVAIFRNSRLAWYGPITRVRYARDTVQVEGRDVLVWLRRRGIHTDLKATEDVSDFFLRIWNSANDPDPIHEVNVITTKTGTVEAREALVADNRYAWSIAKEMMDSALDVTAFGKTVLAGNISNSRPIELSLTDIAGEPELIKDGMLFANRVIVDANEQVVGIYPPGDPAANESYPLVEAFIKDAQIQNVESAQNAAKARYEFSRAVPRLVNISNGIILSPNTDIPLEALIPGSIVNLATDVLCYDTRESYRLGDVDVEVKSGTETVSIGLQPTGPAINLAEAEDAVI